ncbi:hypothetical protein EJ110_NYTH01699, partial [Nymphaea thermarum]
WVAIEVWAEVCSLPYWFSRRSDDYGWDSDAQSGQEDLRLKLIRKNSSRRQRERVDGRERINADLREKLSRTGRSSASIDVHSRIPDPRAAGFVGRIPPTRSADDLLQMDSMRRSYSAWDMNELRRKSPERSLIIPRGISPPANMDELRRLQSMRNDTSRQLPLHSMRNATSRPLPFTNKAPMSFQPTKPVVRLSSTSVVNGPKPSCLAAEHTVTSLLHSLGLSKYAILFQAEEVDMTALRQMGDTDLKELGIPMGPRKKILLALLPRAKPRPG